MGRAFKIYFQKIFTAMLVMVTLYGLIACGGSETLGSGDRGDPFKDGNPQIGGPVGGVNQAAVPGDEAVSPTADWSGKIAVLNCAQSTGSNIPNFNSLSDDDPKDKNKVIYHINGKIVVVFAGIPHPCESCKGQTVRAVDRKLNKFNETKVDENGAFSVKIITEVGKTIVDFYRLEDVNYSSPNFDVWQSCATQQCVETPPWLELPPSYKDTSCDFLQGEKKIFLKKGLSGVNILKDYSPDQP